MNISEYIKKYEETEQYRVIMNTIKQDHYSYCGDTIYDEEILDRMLKEVNDISSEDDIDYANGATKVVIIYNEIVIKKTFTGYIDFSAEGDEVELIDYDMKNQDSYDYSPDYCALESVVYEEAFLKGLQDFFAEVIQVSKNVYAQLRTDHTLSGFFLIEDLGLTKIDVEEIREEYGFEPLIPDYAIAWWFIHKTSEHLQTFSDFLYDHKINDLHSSNIGFFNGEIKLFDYSGYNSGTENTFQFSITIFLI